MIRFSENLFLTENTKGKIDGIKLKAYSGIGMLGFYFITLSSNKNDVFDIYPASFFKQRAVRKRDYAIVGVAESEYRAFELITELIEDCLNNKSEDMTMREYFESIIKW